MSKISIPSLSIEVVKQCNIKCEGCNHFTNFVSTKHILSTDEIHNNLDEWSKILDPLEFRIVDARLEALQPRDAACFR